MVDLEHGAHVSASRWHSDYITHFFTQTGAVIEEEAFYCKHSHLICKEAMNT